MTNECSHVYETTHDKWYFEHKISLKVGKFKSKITMNISLLMTYTNFSYTTSTFTEKGLIIHPDSTQI